MASVATDSLPAFRIPAAPPSSPTAIAATVPWQRALWYSLGPIALLLLRISPAPLNAMSYPCLAVYSLLGRRQAILALFLLYFFNTWTHAFGEPPRLASIFRHFNILVAAFSVLVIHLGRRPRSTIPGFLWWTAGLSALLIAHSGAMSTMPSISILKAISFALTIQTLLTGWSSLSREERTLLEYQIFGFLNALAVFSVPLIGRPAGYLRRTRFFKGLLVHSQTFGPTMAYLATWAITSWLSQRRGRLLLFASFTLSCVMLYLTKSRIALVVLLAGIAAGLIFGPVIHGLSQLQADQGIRKGRLVLLAVVIAVAAGVAGPRLVSSVNEFLKKGRETESVVDAVKQSREFVVERMLSNIRNRPLTGIGFGVPSNPDVEDWYGYTRDPFFGLPIMAPVEKGVMPIAMIEEMGVPLAMLYFVWMGGLFWLSARAGVVPAALCAAGFATGVAEAALFSPGGAGMMTLVLVTMAATTPRSSKVGKFGHAAPAV
jgi:uncharacterized membrane protein YhdT